MAYSETIMSHRKLHVGTNLKMYKTIKETVAYLTELQKLTSDLAGDLLLFVIPSYTALPAATTAVEHPRIWLGAQNMNWEEKGQFTGEISPLMLQELALEIVEIGHSERRHVFRETDIEENKKVLSAISHGFTALLCIGETAEDKQLDIGDERLRQQLKVGLYGVKEEDCGRLWVAYEPVWAIGVHGIPARADYADAKHRVIRKTLVQLFPREGRHVPVLYGGSVNPENAGELISQPAIDGLFIGRSAWEASAFNALIRQILPVWRQKTAAEKVSAPEAQR
jgi:triosephosphate isomerase